MHLHNRAHSHSHTLTHTLWSRVRSPTQTRSEFAASQISQTSLAVNKPHVSHLQLRTAGAIAATRLCRRRRCRSLSLSFSPPGD